MYCRVQIEDPPAPLPGPAPPPPHPHLGPYQAGVDGKNHPLEFKIFR